MTDSNPGNPAPLVLRDARWVGLLAAELVANRLRARPRLRLILPTGHTPLPMYAALRAQAAAGALPARDATLFQLDEYLGLGPGNEGSYAAYLRRELRGVRLGAVHELDGSAPDPVAECARHQALLGDAPLDLVVLGLGRDGHVAFDEPGSDMATKVRRVALHPTTRADAAPDFGGEREVPHEALTVGLGTLIAARELIVLVTGPHKAPALAAMLAGPRGPGFPASLLTDHPRLTVICDRDAARHIAPRPSWQSDHVAIVLGHREPTISAEHRISAESRARLRRAARLCRRDPPRAVILTGYTRTGGLSEAEQMEAEWAGDPPAVMEDAGRDTAENASRSLPLIAALGEVRRVTVVTSAWHLRAPYFFAPYRRFGLRVSFRFTLRGRWVRMLRHEFRHVRRMRAERARAMAAVRMPPDSA
jgi:glucosamine-6-phosphate deaminase